PATLINYRLAAGTFVTLKVYDVLGNEVAELVNEEKPAGNHSITFNASGLGSGVYFYKLNAGNFSDTKKLILMK
ncbi:MAG: T9SS type A sorting domain-containing protein, partial [Ignavibacteriaceae bacterium]